MARDQSRCARSSGKPRSATSLGRPAFSSEGLGMWTRTDLLDSKASQPGENERLEKARDKSVKTDAPGWPSIDVSKDARYPVTPGFFRS
jgi:hypothetical protein